MARILESVLLSSFSLTAMELTRHLISKVTGIYFTRFAVSGTGKSVCHFLDLVQSLSN